MYRGAWCQSFGVVTENYILDVELAGCTLYLRQGRESVLSISSSLTSVGIKPCLYSNQSPILKTTLCYLLCHMIRWTVISDCKTNLWKPILNSKFFGRDGKESAWQTRICLTKSLTPLFIEIYDYLYAATTSSKSFTTEKIQYILWNFVILIYYMEIEVTNILWSIL